MIDSAPSLAVFCDYENLAIGAKDAKFESFDIGLVLERLLDKGKIVLKRAYCDWERYRAAKRALHEAAFEMIEIPHVSYSGKNSADIHLCVDALDLCHTKAHIDIFVIVSGDSDFSPLVSKLRENAKNVIGVGIKSSSSELLIENCDEFIFYDDLVREKHSARKDGKRKAKSAEKKPAKKPVKNGDEKRPASPERSPEPGPAPAPAPAGAAAVEPASSPESGGDKEDALEAVLDTCEALFRERDENLWGSMVKQTLKRKKPHFNETYHGYSNFNQLLEDAEKRGLLEIQKDEKSGGYLIVSFGPNA
jgi:uncharacterized protein (TIGR00288 family)